MFNRYGVDSFKMKTYRLLLTIFFENFAINLKQQKCTHENDIFII